MRAAWDFGMSFISPQQQMFWKIWTSSTGLCSCHNPDCLTAESLHTSRAIKGFRLLQLGAEFSSVKDTEGKSSSFCSRQCSLFVDPPKSKWWTVNSRAEMPLQRIISLAVDHAWLYATNAISLFMRACSPHLHVCRHEHMHAQQQSSHTKGFKPKSFHWEHTVKYMGLITRIALFSSPLAFKIMHAWLVLWTLGLPAYFHGYQCVQDLLGDLVSCNLHLLIRRMQKGWNERRSD